MKSDFIKTQFSKPVYVCDIRGDDCAFADKKGKCELFPDVEEARECGKHLRNETTKANNGVD